MRAHLRQRATKLAGQILAAQRVATAPGNSFVAAPPKCFDRYHWADASQNGRISSLFHCTRHALVATSRSCSGGARNATHAIITTGC